MKADILPIRNDQWIKSKWRIKLEPNEKIIESLQKNFAERYPHEIGFAEFKLIGSVWADSVQYAISEAFGNVKPIAPYGYDDKERKIPNGDFTETERKIAEKVQKGETLTKEEIDQRKKLEVLFCWGTISWKERDKEVSNKFNEAKAHAHITFAENRKKGNAFGGHLIEATVSIVAEIIVDVTTTGKSTLGTENWDMMPIKPN